MSRATFLAIDCNQLLFLAVFHSEAGAGIERHPAWSRTGHSHQDAPMVPLAVSGASSLMRDFSSTPTSRSHTACHFSDLWVLATS